MFYVSNISGDVVSIMDTEDGVVENYNKDTIKQLMFSNPDMIIKGVGIAATNPKELKFKFTVYELSETEKARVAGGRAPITRFKRLPDESQPRNHYYCAVCDTLLQKKWTHCPKCKAGIIYPSNTPVANFVTDSVGIRYFFSSVNGARNMLKDRMFRYA